MLFVYTILKEKYINMLPKLDTLEIQEGKLGKPLRQIGVRRNLINPAKWIGKNESYHWIYTFVYIDKSGSFEIEIDYQNKFVSKKSL